MQSEGYTQLVKQWRCLVVEQKEIRVQTAVTGVVAVAAVSWKIKAWFLLSGKRNNFVLSLFQRAVLYCEDQR